MIWRGSQLLVLCWRPGSRPNKWPTNAAGVRAVGRRAGRVHVAAAADP